MVNTDLPAREYLTDISFTVSIMLLIYVQIRLKLGGKDVDLVSKWWQQAHLHFAFCLVRCKFCSGNAISEKVFSQVSVRKFFSQVRQLLPRVQYNIKI